MGGPSRPPSPAAVTAPAFSTLTTAQLLHALTSRHSTGSSSAHARGSPLLLGVVAGSIALQLLAVAAPPLRRLLGTTALSGADWALVAAGVGAPLLLRRAVRGGRLPLTL